MKKVPLTIKELDIQPLSDEDLKAFEDVHGAGESDVFYCDCDSQGGWRCGYLIVQ